MTKKHLGAALALLALAAAAPSAHAQSRKRGASSAAASTAAAPAAQPQLIQGPPIAGMCIFSRDQALGTSSVGRAYQTRMQQLESQAQAEFGGQQTQLQADEKVLIGKKATLSQEQFNQQAQPFAQREQALTAQVDARTRDLRYTAARQQQKIAQAMQPLVVTAYQNHHCAVLLNGDTVMAANPAMNLTDEVVTALNGRMSTITFDRETAPAQ